jgi:PhnB protein
MKAFSGSLYLCRVFNDRARVININIFTHMSKLMPNVRFNDGKCREAMDFYKNALGGGELKLMTAGESPMADKMPGKEGLIMHASLVKGGITLIGSDMMRDKAVVGDNVGIMMECDSKKEVDDIFAKFSKGGDIFVKPEKMFWGGYFGVVTDKYGVEWSLHFQMEPMKG